MSLQPTSGESQADLGYVLKRADRLQEAVTVLRKAVALSPEWARPHFYLAEALAQAGDSAAALEEYEKAVHLDPTDAEANLKYGLALYQNDPQAAVIELKRSAQLDPTNPAVYRSLGIVLRRAGDLQGSSSAFQKAANLSLQADRHSQALDHTKAAIQYLRQNDFLHSIDELQLALAIEPESADAKHLLGIALSAIGKWNEARGAFTEALRKKPTDPEIRFNFGVFLGRRGDWQGAIRELREAVTRRPSHLQARCLLSSALARIGDADGSSRELSAAKEFGQCEPEAAP